jgi:hypothetical protein
MLSLLAVAGCGTSAGRAGTTTAPSSTSGWSETSRREDDGGAFAFECVASPTLPSAAQVVEYEAVDGSTGVASITGTFPTAEDASAWISNVAPPAFQCLAADAAIESLPAAVDGADEARALLIESEDGSARLLQVQRSQADVTMLVVSSSSRKSAVDAVAAAQSLVP